MLAHHLVSLMAYDAMAFITNATRSFRALMAASRALGTMLDGA